MISKDRLIEGSCELIVGSSTRYVTKAYDHRQYYSGNITLPIYHVTSRNYIFKDLCELHNFMSGTFSWYVTTLPSLVTIVIVVIGICFYFVAGSCKTK